MPQNSYERVKAQFAENQASLIMDEVYMHPSPLNLPQVATKRALLHAKENADNLLAYLTQGVKILAEEIACLPPIEREAAELAFQHLEYALNAFSISPEQKEEVKSSPPLPLFLQLGILDNEIDEFYQIGRKLLSKKNYWEASLVFAILAILCPHHDTIWFGLGIAEQGQLHLENAVLFYEQTLLINPSRGPAYLYKAECNLELNDHEAASESLAHALALFNSCPSDPHWDAYAKKLKERNSLKGK